MRPVLFPERLRISSVPRAIAAVVSILAATAVGGHAEAKTPLKHASKFSPDLRLRLEQRATIPSSLRSASFVVIVRLNSPPSESLIWEWQSHGIHFERHNGKLINIGPYYGVIVNDETVGLLSRQPDVREILPHAPRMVTPTIHPGPLTKVHELISTIPSWGLKDPDGAAVDGTGVTILDIDSGIDVFHPMFFRADGGYYSWIDTNGNGQLDPDLDAVDLDGDLVVDEGETLLTLGGTMVDLYTGAPVETNSVRLVPGRSFVYADTNGNGKRDHGKAKGFDDSTMALGEPLFVFDDVNGNKVVDPGEKLIRLGTSKIRGVFAVGSGKTYERGINLSEFVVTPNALHGTGVAGILVGGVLGHTDVVGVAPGADLLMLDSTTSNQGADFDWNASILSGFTWAKEHGAKIFVHEYGSQFGSFADGSTEWELVLDALHAEGIVQTTATHNFAGLKGHRDLNVPAQSSETFVLTSNDFSALSSKSYYVFMTCRWRNGDPDMLELRLKHPDQKEVQLWPQTDTKGWEVVTAGGISPGGTAMISAIVRRTNAPNSFVPFPDGNWEFAVNNQNVDPVEIRCNVTDETGYSAAIHWAEGSTDAGTMAAPSTATKAIAVGASVGNLAAANEKNLGLRYYSGRGPRIDGEVGIDITAPSDHFTAAVGNAIAGYGNYTRFDGTSGALPLVSAAIALLLQKEPQLTPDEVTNRLQTSGGSDLLTGETPNNDWGFGRLAVYRMLTGNDPPENTNPIAVITGGSPAYVGQVVQLDASRSHDVDHPDVPTARLKFRWDVGYDGSWDMTAADDAKLAIPIRSQQPFWVKLEVEDEHGGRGYALTQISPDLPPIEPEVDVSETPDGAAGADGTNEDLEQPPPQDLEPTDDNKDHHIAETDEKSNESGGDGCAATSRSNTAQPTTPWHLALGLITVAGMRFRRGLATLSVGLKKH